MNFVRASRQEYERVTGLKPEIYVRSAGNGAEEVGPDRIYKILQD